MTVIAGDNMYMGDIYDGEVRSVALRFVVGNGCYRRRYEATPLRKMVSDSTEHEVISIRT